MFRWLVYIAVAGIAWYLVIQLVTAILAVIFWPLVLISILAAAFAALRFLQKTPYGRDVRRIPWIGRIMSLLDKYSNERKFREAYEHLKRDKLEEFDGNRVLKILCEKVRGQTQVCRDIVERLLNEYAKDKRTKPVGVFMLAGPAATGKTHFSKVLSKALFDVEPVIFPMTQYKDKYSAASLMGAGKSLAGADTYGALTRHIADNPKSVVVLDEFEKADKEVHNLFLNPWNDGFIIEKSNGHKISTTDTIFILTTNAAFREIEQLAAMYATDRRKLQDECKKAVGNVLQNEPLMSRITSVFPFVRLRGIELGYVIVILLEELIVEQYGFELLEDNVSLELIAEMTSHVEDKNIDPRQVARDLEDSLGSQLRKMKTENVKAVGLQGTMANPEIVTISNSVSPE